MRPVVKICGLTRMEDVLMCVRHGVDVLGFVVDYPHPVPWNIGAEPAKKLVSAVYKPFETCIVTGGGVQKVLKTALMVRPDYVQLHTRETVEETAYIVKKLHEYGIKVIKTVYRDTPEKTVAEFSDAGVFALLLDPRTPENAETSGQADLSTFFSFRDIADCPVILAGGLDAGNVAAYVRTANPRMVDLMTGVEHSPGIKDENKVAALMAALTECSDLYIMPSSTNPKSG